MRGCNNTWNRAAAGKGFEQSVFLENGPGKTIIGWRWRAPWHLFTRVVSQPEIVCGNKPWDPKTRPDGGFPFLAGSKRLSSEFEVNVGARGVYNAVFSLRAISAVPATRKGITHEIMIWTDHAGQSPAGQTTRRLNEGRRRHLRRLRRETPNGCLWWKHEQLDICGIRGTKADIARSN